MTPLLTLPREILAEVLDLLEYASDVNAFAQTNRHLCDLANAHLYARYAKDCSPYGLRRVLKNNNVDALRKLIAAGIWFEIHQNGLNKNDCSPIVLAAKSGSQIFREMIDYVTNSGYHLIDASFWPPKQRAVLLSVINDLPSATDEEYEQIVTVLMNSGILKDPGFQSQPIIVNAAGRGNLSLVKRLVEEFHVKFDFWDPDGKAPINIAAKNGHLHIVQYFLEAGIDLTLLPCIGFKSSPLVSAISNKHEHIVQLLLSHGARVRLADVRLRDLVTLAFGELIEVSDIIPQYITWDELLKINDPKKWDDVLILACIAGDEAWTQELLNIGHLQSISGAQIALYFAAKTDSAQVAESVFSRWVQLHLSEPCATDSEMGIFNRLVIELESIIEVNPRLIVPLFTSNIASQRILGQQNLARGEGDGFAFNIHYFSGSQTVNYLIEQEMMGHLSYTVDLWSKFSTAIRSKNYSCIETIFLHSGIGALEQHELDENTGYQLHVNHRSFLQVAICHGSVEGFFNVLEISGVELNANSLNCCHAFLSAASVGEPQIVQHFLDRGFDANFSLLNESTRLEAPLIRAISGMEKDRNGRVYLERQEQTLTTVRLLLDHGAEANVKDLNGITAISIAVRLQLWDFCELLIERGANPVIGFEEGKSAIDELIKIGERKWTPPDPPEMKGVPEKLFDMVPSREFFEEVCPRVMPPPGDGLVWSSRQRPRFSNKYKPLFCGDHPETPDTLNPAPVQWRSFFVLKAARRSYWRRKYPVPDL